MDKIFRRFGVILGAIGVVLGVSLASSSRVEALSINDMGLTTVSAIQFVDGQFYNASCEKNLFGMRPWYAGLTVKVKVGDEYKCAIGTPKNDDEVAKMVWVIILNIMTDISVIIGYLALGFIIYGGYLYILSGGDSGKVAKGKKTLIGAVIGIAISLLASVIVNTILAILAGE